jgi:LysM repeat protein
LYSLNPRSREAIYEGERLYLPEKKDTTSVQILQDEEFLYHIVKSGETFFSISQNYGFKERQLKKYNKDIDHENLTPEQVIKIPTSAIDVKAKAPGKKDDKYFYYNVKQGDNLFSISQHYQISETLIKSHNPDLKQRELLAGEYLKLPYSLITIEETPDTIPVQQNTKKVFITDTCQCSEIGQTTINVALMLPLYGYTNDTVNERSSRLQIYNRSQIFIDYYEGTLLAVNELSKKGLNIELHLFDTENDTNTVHEIVNQDIFPYFDLIIGPVYSKNIPIIVERARLFNIPVISPLSTETSFLKDYRLGFQVSPPEEILLEQSIAQISQFNADNYVIIKNGNNPQGEFINLFKKSFFEGKHVDEIDHLGYAEVNYFAGDDELRLDSFNDSAHNLVIIPSPDKAFVSDVVSRLNTLHEKYTITLFGHPRWVNYDNIDIRFFHNLNTHVYSLNYIDYDLPAVKNFVYDFRKFFSKEPDKYAFYGYDITYYFLHAMQLFGENFYCCFDRFYPQLLQMSFNYQQQCPEEGFINQKMQLLNYQRNYLLRPLKPTKE